MGHKSGGKASASTCARSTSAAASSAPIAPTVQLPTTDAVTPAVARDVSTDTQTAQQNQRLARSRLTGIRSTWAGFGAGRSSTLGS